VRELKLKLRCVTAPMLFCKSMSHWELLVICVQEYEPARLSWRDFFKAGCGIRTTRLSGARAIYSNERILSGPTILRGYFFDGSIIKRDPSLALLVRDEYAGRILVFLREP